MRICSGLFSLTWFEKELRGLLSGQGAVHPLLAVYLIVLAYLIAVFVVNRTTLRIHRDRLDVSRGPIPVPFARPLVFTRDQVVAFTLYEHRSYKSNSVSYELYDVRADPGQEVNLASREPRAAAANGRRPRHDLARDPGGGARLARVGPEVTSTRRGTVRGGSSRRLRS